MQQPKIESLISWPISAPSLTCVADNQPPYHQNHRMAGMAISLEGHKYPPNFYAGLDLSSARHKNFKQVDELCKRGLLDDALDILEQRGIPLHRENAYWLLQECSRRKTVELCRRLQGLMRLSGLDSIPVLGDHLIRLFTSCRSLHEAEQAFRRVSQPSVYSWSSIISAYVEQADTAVDRYQELEASGLKSNKCIYLAILKACALAFAIKQGRIVHERIMKSGLQYDNALGSALIDMYAKCGSLEEARDLFDKLQDRDVVCWNAMVVGYVQHGECLQAIECFKHMAQEGINPDEISLSSVIKACGIVGAIDEGTHTHKQIITRDICSSVLDNALIDMYAKCRNLEKATEVFRNMLQPDIVSWNTIIVGYAQNDNGILALECYKKMQEDGIEPDKVTFLGILKACGRVGAIEQGHFFHHQTLKRGLHLDITMENTLLDMYSNCGSLEDAGKMFQKMLNRNLISWNAMIAGYAQHGYAALASQYLQDMERTDVKPNGVTFVGVLSACSHVGLLDEGYWYLGYMREVHAIMPDILHVNCMIDLLGRAGHFEEAQNLIQFTMRTNLSGHMALLSACCRIYGSVEICELRLFQGILF